MPPYKKQLPSALNHVNVAHILSSFGVVWEDSILSPQTVIPTYVTLSLGKDASGVHVWPRPPHFEHIMFPVPPQPRHLTFTMIPWLSSIESTYKPEPAQVAHSTAPLASQLVQGGLSPTFFFSTFKPVGLPISSSGTDLS